MIGYVATETFNPSDSEGWIKYIEWSRLDQLKEVISLDCMLCQSVIDDLIDEDWNHKVYVEVFHDLFGDLDYLLSRIRPTVKYQILAIMRNPGQNDVSSFTDVRFDFKGYDLVEDLTRTSALTNCAGFDSAFSNRELTESGLISGHWRAYEIRDDLSKYYPDEPHADCAIWAIWKMRLA